MIDRHQPVSGLKHVSTLPFSHLEELIDSGSQTIVPHPQCANYGTEANRSSCEYFRPLNSQSEEQLYQLTKAQLPVW